MKRYPWKWARGKINRNKEHIEIRFGSVERTEIADWIPVAIVSAAVENTFIVEFLLSEDEPENKEMIRRVEEELTFYLVKEEENDPWAYSRYHCTTAANLYSMVHWSLIQKKILKK